MEVFSIQITLIALPLMEQESWCLTIKHFILTEPFIFLDMTQIDCMHFLICFYHFFIMCFCLCVIMYILSFSLTFSSNIFFSLFLFFFLNPFLLFFVHTLMQVDPFLRISIFCWYQCSSFLSPICSWSHVISWWNFLCCQ